MSKIRQNCIYLKSSSEPVALSKSIKVLSSAIEEIEDNFEQRESDWLTQQMYLQDALGFYL
jgi:hypothetical protein